MAIIDKIPHWLRWILFLSLVVLAYLVSEALYPILRITFEMSAPGGLEWAGDSMAIIMGSAIRGIFLVWTGTRIAPMYKLQVGIVLTSLFGLSLAFMIYAKYVGLSESLARNSWFEVIVNLVVGVGGAIFVITTLKNNSGHDAG